MVEKRSDDMCGYLDICVCNVMTFAVIGTFAGAMLRYLWLFGDLGHLWALQGH